MSTIYSVNLEELRFGLAGRIARTYIGVGGKQIHPQGIVDKFETVE